VNSWVGVNFIADNPKMATPPAFWLRQLYHFDPDLAVLPSRQRPYAYVLARKARRSFMATPAKLFRRETDTSMCHQYGYVPVSLIFQTGPVWSIDNLLRDLRARDTWRDPQMAEKADALDVSDRAKLKRTIRDDMWHRAGDAWRSYQARTGQRTKLQAPVARSAGTGSPHVIQAAVGV